MSTSIEAKVVRSLLNPDSFAHITGPDVKLTDFDRDGLLFDGALTDEQIGDVWWFATSKDDADQTARANIAALRDTDTTASPLLCAVAAYLLGET